MSLLFWVCVWVWVGGYILYVSFLPLALKYRWIKLRRKNPLFEGFVIVKKSPTSQTRNLTYPLLCVHVLFRFSMNLSWLLSRALHSLSMTLNRPDSWDVRNLRHGVLSQYSTLMSQCTSSCLDELKNAMKDNMINDGLSKLNGIWSNKMSRTIDSPEY